VWNKISSGMIIISFIVPVSLMCTDIQLKKTYSSIQKYQETSGFHWDNTTGATVKTPAEENVWNEYSKIKVCHGYHFILYLFTMIISIYLFSPMPLSDPFAIRGGICSRNFK
jgi:hypothetical protein